MSQTENISDMPRWGGEAVPIATGMAAPLAPPPTMPVVNASVKAVTATSWPPLAIALGRGAIEGFILGGLDMLTALSLDFSTRDSFISAGIIFFARLAIALGVGGIDSWTAAKERHP